MIYVKYLFACRDHLHFNHRRQIRTSKVGHLAEKLIEKLSIMLKVRIAANLVYSHFTLDHYGVTL